MSNIFSHILAIVSLFSICKIGRGLEEPSLYKQCRFSDASCWDSYVKNTTASHIIRQCRVYWPYHGGQTMIPKSSCKVERQATVIVDLRCYHIFVGPFHQLFDCYYPNIPLIAAIVDHPYKDTYILTSPQLRKYVVASLPDKWSSRFLSHDTCIYSNNSTTVYYSVLSDFPSRSRYFDIDPNQMKKNFVLARHMIFQKFHIQSDLRNILFVERIGARSMHPSARSYFQEHFNKMLPHLPFKVFYGNETVEETVRLFSSAQVVIGFHGAAAANLVFLPPNAIVMEITVLVNMTYVDSFNVSRIYFGGWRSFTNKNIILQNVPFPIEYLQYVIDPGFNFNNITNIDYYLHFLIQDIVIPDSALINIVEIVARVVKFNRKEELGFQSLN